MPEKRLVLIDDHPLFREGLKSLIARSTEYVVVGEAGSFAEALKLLAEVQPKIITLDITLPDVNGIEAAREIRQKFPAIRILVVSMHDKVDIVVGAYRAGAHGFLLKDSSAASLVEALDTVYRGEFYIDGKLSGDVIARMMLEENNSGNSQDDRYNLLSNREQQILRMVVEGSTSTEIGVYLGLKVKTVENHRANLMKKLGVHSRLELVRYAARIGVIDLDSWKE